MNPQKFVDQLASIELPNVFNPYRDTCVECDHDYSSKIRRSNLIQYLDAIIVSEVDSIWLGRDCGYRGARRTGIALTDEMHLEALENHFMFKGLTKATIGLNVKERTATEIWKIIPRINENVFLWNIFPFHPHESDNPMSNRRHSTREFNECRDILISLIGWLCPKRVITLGLDAYKTTTGLGIHAVPVRHPSYGGHIEFSRKIQQVYFDSLISEKANNTLEASSRSLF